MTNSRGTVVPLVTVLIPMRDEERSIGTCLDSLLLSEYPPDRYEILVIDDASSDRSPAIVTEYVKRCARITLIHSAHRKQAAALNTGVRHSRGDIVMRADAHTTYAPDYIPRCVDLLLRSGATNVGGVMKPAGTNRKGLVVAMAFESAFGLKSGRPRRHPVWTDTVYLGCWRRETLESLGGFDEEAPPDEDFELNCRLRQAGGRILCSPDVVCEYHVRESMRALGLQFGRYGWSRGRTLALHPETWNLRTCVPAGFAAAVIGAILLSPISWYPAAALAVIYVFACLAGSIDALDRHGWRYASLLPSVLFLMHFMYGGGLIAGGVRYAPLGARTWRSSPTAAPSPRFSGSSDRRVRKPTRTD